MMDSDLAAAAVLLQQEPHSSLGSNTDRMEQLADGSDRSRVKWTASPRNLPGAGRRVGQMQGLGANLCTADEAWAG